MKSIFSLALTLLFLVSLEMVAFGQGNAALIGTVTDPQGAVVAGTKVTATNVATNVSWDTQTTDAGLYRFPTLPVGNYTVVVEATGFKSAKITNLILTVGQAVTQDIRLEVGTPTETVLVQAGG